MKIQLIKTPGNQIPINKIPENTICVITHWGKRDEQSPHVGKFIIRFGNIVQTVENVLRQTAGDSWLVHEFRPNVPYEAEIVPKGSELKITV